MFGVRAEKFLLLTRRLLKTGEGMHMVSEKGRFRILVALVLISGFSQGMLLPLIAVILEQKGISSSVNGLHATGLYIGVLLASPFMEKPLRTYGYKPIILTGGAFVFLSLFFFTLWESLWFWFMLRMLIGIGDHVLHFGTQTWITTTSEKHNREDGWPCMVCHSASVLLWGH